MNQIKNCRNYSYSLQYHIVWCVRDGIDLLENNVQSDLVEILTKIALDNGVGLLDINIANNCVHVKVDCSPQIKIPNLLKALKGVSGRLILKKYPVLKCKLDGESLWKLNYFIATPSKNIEELVMQYLRKQVVKG